MKSCTSCGTTCPLRDFPKSSASPDGRYSWCRDCKNAAAREYTKSDKGRATRIAYRRSDAARACRKPAASPCEWCGLRFSRSQSRPKPRFCSRPCFQRWRQSQKPKPWGAALRPDLPPLPVSTFLRGGVE